MFSEYKNISFLASFHKLYLIYSIPSNCFCHIKLLRYLHFDDFLPSYLNMDTTCYFAFLSLIHSFIKKYWALLMPGTLLLSSERAVDKIDKRPHPQKVNIWRHFQCLDSSKAEASIKQITFLKLCIGYLALLTNISSRSNLFS